MILALAPEDFAKDVKAWIEAGSAILDLVIAKVGLLAIAFYGLLKIFRTQDSALKSEVQAMKERQDRQGDRIDQVALSVPPAMTSTVRIEQPADEPIPVKETPQP